MDGSGKKLMSFSVVLKLENEIDKILKCVCRVLYDYLWIKQIKSFIYLFIYFFRVGRFYCVSVELFLC